MKYFVYIVQCADGSLYTGITTDVERRLVEHNDDDIKSAKYTKNRRPVDLVYCKECGNRSSATKEEIRIKKLTRQQKERLIRSDKQQ